ncbi:MAG: hypothetical protein MAGBODY4_00337 [Candidatus Marinimicrobia bacterium]|nr:hypothetical protein [Candidatus Neomarinimicrobiota bacterium]
MHFVATQNIRYNFNVLQPGIGARSEENLVEFRTLDFRHRRNIIHRMRFGDLRRQIGDIVVINLLKFRIVVGSHDIPVIAGVLLQIFYRLFIWNGISGFRAELHRHIAHHEPAGDGHSLDCRTSEFHCFV